MKTAIVTGASEGIGRAFSQALLAEGYRVIAVARNQARLESLRVEVGSAASRLECVVADLTRAEGVAEVEAILGRGHVDLLINNAGVGVYGAFPETAWDKYADLLLLNVFALTKISHAFLGQARSGDALINLSSVLAFLPMPVSGVYAASKAYVTSFTESLWQEQKSRGVYVMGLCPGITETEFNRRAGGFGNDLPKALSESPEQVVKTALSALRTRSQPTVVCGVANTALSSTYRFIPRKWLVSLMAKTQPRTARQVEHRGR